jgi:hypothetical protein
MYLSCLSCLLPPIISKYVSILTSHIQTQRTQKCVCFVCYCIFLWDCLLSGGSRLLQRFAIPAACLKSNNNDVRGGWANKRIIVSVNTAGGCVSCGPRFTKSSARRLKLARVPLRRWLGVASLLCFSPHMVSGHPSTKFHQQGTKNNNMRTTTEIFITSRKCFHVISAICQ